MMFKDNQKLKKQIEPLKNLDDLPGNIRISTITIICRFDTDFYCANIRKYINLSPDGAVPPKKKRSRKKKKVKRAFFNQATIIVRSTPDKTINE